MKSSSKILFSNNSNKDFVFLTYPYEGGGEIHGFERNAIAKYSNTDYVKFVCRGGFFGGKKDVISEINSIYYGLMNDTFGLSASTLSLIEHSVTSITFLG